MISSSLGLVLFIPIVITVGLLFFVFHRRKVPNAIYILGYLTGGLVGATSYALELIKPALGAKIFWHSGYYLGMVMSMPFFLCFAIRYKHSQYSFSRRFLAGVFLPSFFVFLANATNGWHHLFYRTVWLDTSGALPALLKTNGPLYWLSMLWVHSLILASLGILLSMLPNTRAYYRNQTALIASSIVIPLVANALYLLNIRPWGLLNLTPFATTITGLVCSLAILRYRLLDLAPVAHNVVFEKIPFGVIVLDQLGRIVDINPAAQGDLGMAWNKNLIGQTLEGLSISGRELMLSLLNEPLPSTLEAKLPKGGEERLFFIELVPFKVQDDPACRIIILHDITSRRKAELHHIEQERLTSIYAERERLSNDLHDGIGQIMGYASAQIEAALVYLGSGQTSLAQATLARLAEVTRSAHADLRAFILGMRQDAQKGETPESAGQDFGASLSGFCAQFSSHYELPVKLSLPGDSTRLVLDPAIEMNILWILKEGLTNVRTHAQASQAEVTLLVSHQEIELIVTDDGCGFNPAGAGLAGPKARISDCPAAPQGHFGLQIMRARAAEMNGSLEIRSSPGAGASLIFRVPRRQPGAPLDLTPMTVLLVDDQPLFRSGLRNLLSARGLQVIGEANDGEQGVLLAERLRPNLVLMDCHMPGIDGIEATRQIKAGMPETRVVMLTVEEDQEMLFRAIRNGASGYLLKDMKPEEFFVMLESLMRGETPISPALAVRMITETAYATEGRSTTPLPERQMHILRLAGRGLTNREIASTLSLSESSIKYHLHQIFEVLQVNTRDEALVAAQKKRWIE